MVVGHAAENDGAIIGGGGMPIGCSAGACVGRGYGKPMAKGPTINGRGSGGVALRTSGAHSVSDRGHGETNADPTQSENLGLTLGGATGATIAEASRICPRFILPSPGCTDCFISSPSGTRARPGGARMLSGAKRPGAGRGRRPSSYYCNRASRAARPKRP